MTDAPAGTVAPLPPEERMTTTPPGRRSLGPLAFVLGALALACAVLPPVFAKEPEPRPKSSLVDAAKGLAGRIAEKVKGSAAEEADAPPAGGSASEGPAEREAAPDRASEEPSAPWTGKLTPAATGLGFLAVLLAGIAWIRHENRRLCFVATAFGVTAIAWQYLIVAAAVGVVLAVALTWASLTS